MTMRERMLAVIQQRAVDRVPFVQYSEIAGPGTDRAAQALLGRDKIGFSRWTSVHAYDTPNCGFERQEFARNGRRGERFLLHTPKGTLTSERIFEPALGTSAAARHFVQDPKDYETLLAYLRDIRVHGRLEPLEQTVRDLGDEGLPHINTPRTPYQQLWVEWVNIQDLAQHLCDLPDLLEEVTATLFDIQERVYAVVRDAARKSFVPYVVVGDNITAPMIGETYFRRYCLPSYRKLAEALDETGQDIPVVVHMDGDLKPLWRAIGESRVRGLDSMSPPPDNDTSVGDALRMWPEMRVLVNFPSSIHLKPPEAIYAKAMEILEEGGRTGRLQIQISENLPPDAWRTSYPAIVQAIDDFGGG